MSNSKPNKIVNYFYFTLFLIASLPVSADARAVERAEIARMQVTSVTNQAGKTLHIRGLSGSLGSYTNPKVIIIGDEAQILNNLRVSGKVNPFNFKVPVYTAALQD